MRMRDAFFFLVIKSVQRLLIGQCNEDQQAIRGRFDLLLLKPSSVDENKFVA